MKFKTLPPQLINNKKILIRADFNVPIAPAPAGEAGKIITDNKKIKLSLETINFCLKNKAKQIILMSHLGRPKGKVDLSLSLLPVAQELSRLLNLEIKLINNFAEAKNINNKIILLENLRFDPGEKKNDSQLGKNLAQLADIYINEAFSASHRKHASVVAVTKFLPSYAGFSLIKEVEHLNNLLANPKRPFVVIVGGAKISDKLTAIEHLSKLADTILVGGGIANNFLKAEHFEIYKSYLEDNPADLKKEGLNFVNFADKLLDSNKQENTLVNGFPLPKILYPVDVLAGSDSQAKQAQKINLLNNFNSKNLNDNLMYLDIGPKTIDLYKKVIASAKTIFWNGPMGVFENEIFSQGSKEIAKVIASNKKAYTVVGGGETLKTIHKFKLEQKYDYVSAAGGAALEFLSGRILPGLKVLS